MILMINYLILKNPFQFFITHPICFSKFSLCVFIPEGQIVKIWNWIEYSLISVKLWNVILYDDVCKHVLHDIHIVGQVVLCGTHHMSEHFQRVFEKEKQLSIFHVDGESIQMYPGSSLLFSVIILHHRLFQSHFQSLYFIWYLTCLHTTY
jgi:hypothetical protein